MPSVFFKGNEYPLQESESILDCLLRNGHRIPFACRSGVCQSCMLAQDNSHPSIDAAVLAQGTYQQGLSDAHRQLNYLISCQSQPQDDIALRPVEDAGNQVSTTVVAKRWLNPSVMQLLLEGDLEYRAGQFVTLWRNDRCARSYSLASVPGHDKQLEFHVRHIADGEFSGWLANCIHKGDKITLRGAMGSFFFSSERHQPLILCAIGTGLAPVLGVLRTALANGHQASIDLIVAARHSNDFYHIDELIELAQEHANLRLHWLAQSLQPSRARTLRLGTMLKADIYQYCLSEFPDTGSYHYYLCGAESFVKKMRKQLFLAGADLAAIRSDAFIASV